MRSLRSYTRLQFRCMLDTCRVSYEWPRTAEEAAVWATCVGNDCPIKQCTERCITVHKWIYLLNKVNQFIPWALIILLTNNRSSQWGNKINIGKSFFYKITEIRMEKVHYFWNIKLVRTSRFTIIMLTSNKLITIVYNINGTREIYR